MPLLWDGTLYRDLMRGRTAAVERPPTMNEHESCLHNYLTMVSASGRLRPGLVYCNPGDFLLQQWRWFEVVPYPEYLPLGRGQSPLRQRHFTLNKTVVLLSPQKKGMLVICGSFSLLVSGV
jgi:hypothetical protein